MIISKSKNFIFIHIEKTGGTSIEEALLPFLSKNDIIFGGVTLDNTQKKLETELWKHSDANRIKEEVKEKWNTMYKFSIVRNPIEIMKSFYFYINKNLESLLIGDITQVVYDKNLKNEIEYDGSIVYTDDLRDLYFIESQLDGSEIDGFITKMIVNNLKEVAPQISKVDDSVELFDLSNINNDWPIILNNIGLDKNIKLQVHNSSNKPKDIKLKNETINLILNHFKQDYQIIDKNITKNWHIK